MRITAKKGFFYGMSGILVLWGVYRLAWVNSDTVSAQNQVTASLANRKPASSGGNLLSQDTEVSHASGSVSRGPAILPTATIAADFLNDWNQFLERHAELKEFYQSIYHLDDGVDRAVVMSLMSERVGFGADKEAAKFYEFAQGIIAKDPKKSYESFAKVLPYVPSKDSSERVMIVQSMVRLTSLNPELIPASKNLLIKEISKLKELDSQAMTFVPLLVHLDQGEQWHQDVEERLKKWNSQINWKSYLTQFDPIPEAAE